MDVLINRNLEKYKFSGIRKRPPTSNLPIKPLKRSVKVRKYKVQYLAINVDVIQISTTNPHILTWKQATYMYQEVGKTEIGSRLPESRRQSYIMAHTGAHTYTQKIHTHTHKYTYKIKYY